MALPDYTRNLYGPVKQGDLSLVLIKLGAGSGQAALVAAESSPGVTVATPGAGVYNCTFPCGNAVLLAGAESVNQTTVKGAVTALVIANGVCSFTMTLSDAGDLATTEQFHLSFFTGTN